MKLSVTLLAKQTKITFVSVGARHQTHPAPAAALQCACRCPFSTSSAPTTTDTQKQPEIPLLQTLKTPHISIQRSTGIPLVPVACCCKVRVDCVDKKDSDPKLSLGVRAPTWHTGALSAGRQSTEKQPRAERRMILTPQRVSMVHQPWTTGRSSKHRCFACQFPLFCAS